MKALTVITATVYAVALWMFAPQNRWDEEVATAKCNRLNQKPEPVPTPELEASAQPETEPEPIIEIVEQIPDIVNHPITESEPITEIVEPDTNPIETDTVPTPERLNLETFTTTQLREMAKKQKLNWRPLINGKRKPLNKPQLIQLLTA
jgi:hypothetical protein